MLKYVKKKNAVCGFCQRNDNNSQSYYSTEYRLCLFDNFVTIRLGAIIAQICKEKNAVCGFRQRNDNNSQSYYPTEYRLCLFERS